MKTKKIMCLRGRVSRLFRLLIIVDERVLRSKSGFSLKYLVYKCNVESKISLP